MTTPEEQIENIINSTTQDIIETNMDSNNTNTNEEQENEQEQDTIQPSNFDNIEVFNVALHQYLKISEEIKALLEAVKQRNKAKQEISQTLRTYLQTNNIKSVNLGGSYKGKCIENDVSYTTTGFTKRNVVETLQEELKEDEDLFAKLMQAISTKTCTKEVHKLKFIKAPKVNVGSKIYKASTKIKEAEELLADD